MVIPSSPRLVAASTDPHNAALCVAMDAHLAVVRPDGGVRDEDV